MSSLDILGLIAGALTSTGFVPQLLKAVKTKSTKDISLPMLIILLAGVTLWLIYGFIKQDIPLIAANTVTIVTVGCIFIFKLMYK
jgi:MtN3 and saliva related transmembrane protein